MPHLNRKEVRRKIHRRIRKKVEGTPARPRLAVHFSNQHIYAQVIDDEASRTIASASTLDKSIESKGSNVAAASRIGQVIAERAKGQSIETVVFDRGGFLYEGKVKALADAAREGGLKF
ncbi:MAG: 50S ribosomal protein L18 [Verrucomicrobia bacterium]|nr:50S ribosomal protein L18 [Verrucomicrobiota bacterium]